MSRRWYRHEALVAFMGWEPSDQGFYLNVVELCADCGGSGEVDGTEEICEGCGGEGIPLGALNPSNRQRGLSLDQVAGYLQEHGIPFPYFVKADLEEDQRINAAGSVLHEYDLDADLAAG
jgi:hypothetical protein